MPKVMKCWDCAYKGTIPENAHICCRFDWNNSKLEKPRGKQHGIDNGWWIFPICYDPIWMLNPCLAFSIELDENAFAKRDDLATVLGIFASVGRL